MAQNIYAELRRITQNYAEWPEITGNYANVYVDAILL